MNKNKKIVCIVGLCGAGKSEVADRFVATGYGYFRFGQVVLDEVKKMGLEPNEKIEKKIREGFRSKHGMAAMAILNKPKIDRLLGDGKNVLGDGLYSWSEYKMLKSIYGDKLIIIAVHASPKIRYARLEDRRSRYGDDPNLKYRSFSKADAKLRDYNEIENIEKAGPIVMADYMIINEGTLDELYKTVDNILEKIK